MLCIVYIMFVVQQIKPYKVNYKEYKDRMIKYQDKLDIFKDLKEGECHRHEDVSNN